MVWSGAVVEAVIDGGHGVAPTIVGQSPVLDDGVRGGVGFVDGGAQRGGIRLRSNGRGVGVFDLVGVAAQALGQAADAGHQCRAAAAPVAAGQRPPGPGARADLRRAVVDDVAVVGELLLPVDVGQRVAHHGGEVELQVVRQAQEPAQ